MKKILSLLFSEIFPTAITPFGKHLFYITNENNYVARLKRTGQLYTRYANK